MCGNKVYRKGRIWCAVQYLLLCYSEVCAKEMCKEKFIVFFWKIIILTCSKVQSPS